MAVEVKIPPNNNNTFGISVGWGGGPPPPFNVRGMYVYILNTAAPPSSLNFRVQGLQGVGFGIQALGFGVHTVHTPL